MNIIKTVSMIENGIKDDTLEYSDVAILLRDLYSFISSLPSDVLTSGQISSLVSLSVFISESEPRLVSTMEMKVRILTSIAREILLICDDGNGFLRSIQNNQERIIELLGTLSCSDIQTLYSYTVGSEEVLRKSYLNKTLISDLDDDVHDLIKKIKDDSFVIAHSAANNFLSH